MDHLMQLLDPSTTPAQRDAIKLLERVNRTVPLTEPYEPRQEELDRLSDTLDCANCGNTVSRPALYCADFCKQMADVVRYARGCIGDGRVKQPDIQEAIGTKLLMVTGGGYPARERSLNRAVRNAVFERDKGLCVLCGSPATQIDHIHGNSNDLVNLRAVCRSCNIGLAYGNARQISREDEPELFAQIDELLSELALRIAAAVPLRACDDHAEWNGIQKKLMPSRKVRFREIEEELDGEWEDVDGYLWHSMQKDD